MSSPIASASDFSEALLVIIIDFFGLTNVLPFTYSF